MIGRKWRQSAGMLFQGALTGEAAEGNRRVDVAHRRLDVLPAHVGHQRLDIPAIGRGPGGETAP